MPDHHHLDGRLSHGKRPHWHGADDFTLATLGKCLAVFPLTAPERQEAVQALRTIAKVFDIGAERYLAALPSCRETDR